MISLVVVVVVAAAPTPALLVERDAARAPASALELLSGALREALVARGFAVAEGHRRCGEATDCLQRLAQGLEGVAIGVSLVPGRKGLLVDLEAVAPDGEPLGAVTFVMPPAGEQPPEVVAFVTALQQQWARHPLAARAPRVAPRDTPVRAEERPRLAELEQTPPDEVPEGFWSRTSSKVTLIGAGAASATALALGIAGALMKAQLDRELSLQPPVLTRETALARAAVTNGLLTGSLLSAILAGVGGAVLALLAVAP